jgi:hypothetical protein
MFCIDFPSGIALGQGHASSPRTATLNGWPMCFQARLGLEDLPRPRAPGRTAGPSVGHVSQICLFLVSPKSIDQIVFLNYFSFCFCELEQDGMRAIIYGRIIIYQWLAMLFYYITKFNVWSIVVKLLPPSFFQLGNQCTIKPSYLIGSYSGVGG